MLRNTIHNVILRIRRYGTFGIVLLRLRVRLSRITEKSKPIVRFNLGRAEAYLPNPLDRSNLDPF